MDITEFSMRALNSEVQMIDDFNFLIKKLIPLKMIYIYPLMPQLKRLFYGVMY